MQKLISRGKLNRVLASETQFKIEQTDKAVLNLLVLLDRYFFLYDYYLTYVNAFT